MNNRMIDAKISNLVNGGGALVTADEKSLTEFKTQEVVSLFEEKGAVLFRGFDIVPNNVREITDAYTETYSGEVYRRGYRFDQKIIRNVDPGACEVKLHSEGSFTPAWPEIVWFFCVHPPTKGGATTICDGIEVWKALSAKTKNFLRLNPIRYDLKIPLEKKISGTKKRPWVFDVPGAGNAFIDGETGAVELTQIRSPITEGRDSRLCFSNHMLIDLDSEAQLVRRVLMDGSEIPVDIMSEVRAVSNSLTHEVTWLAGDLLMLDNKRFMHGRRAYEAGDPRDIVVVQTARASFGYGVTTRRVCPGGPLGSFAN